MPQVKNSFFGSHKLADLLAGVAPIQSLDLGARGIPARTMLSMAWAVDAVGFEPDKEECSRLNALYRTEKHPFHQLRLFPVALGKAAQGRTLYLAKHRGTSSLLPPVVGRTAEFMRGDYGEVESTAKVDTVPLDSFLQENRIAGAAHLKMDVEGLELEILQSAPLLLSSSLLAVDMEVLFMQIHAGQPLYGELETFLRNYQFIPLGFTEMHCWRRLTRSKYPKKIKGPIPFSRGQLVHGNMLFMKAPEAVFTQSPDRIISAAFIAMNYGYLDHALFLLQHESVQENIRAAGIKDLTAEVRKVSLMQYRQYRRGK